MTEFENVKDTLKDVIDLAESDWTTAEKGEGEFKPATVEDIQDLVKERLYNIADLLGMSDLYLKD